MNALPIIAALLLQASPDPAALADFAESADEVEISLVRFTTAELDDPSGEALKLVERSPIRKLSRKDAGEVSALVAGLARGEKPEPKRCIFNPDLRLTFKKGTESVQAVFCFSCSDVLIHRSGDKASGVWRGFAQHEAALQALVARIYSDLPEKKRKLGRGHD